MKVIGNVRYIPAGTTQYVVDGSDGEINVDTSLSAITIILPNIVNSGFVNTDKGFIINDNSGNAATNNITIIAANNTANRQSSVLISTNGGSAKCSIASMNEWFIVTEPASSGMSGSLTAGYIPRAVSSSALADSVIYQNSGKIGINTINPLTNFHVSGTNASSIILSTRYSSDNASSGFIAAKARGTEAAPSGILLGDKMLNVSAYGYTSAGAFSPEVGKMVFYATEDFTGSANGTAFKISTTPIGATVDVFNFGISSNGDVSIGDINLSPSARLHVTINSTSSNYALKIDNLAAVSLLSVRNDGFATILDMTVGRGGGLVATNTVLGVAAIANASGGQNTGVGYEVLNTLNTGTSNTAIGYAVLANITSGTTNVGIGASAMQASNPSYSVGIGGGVLYQSSGTGNSGIGHGNFYNLSSGNYNTALGYNAGANIMHTQGNNNLFLGYMADVSVNNLTNASAIGANATVGASNSMVLGNGVNVGIGISIPLAKLHIKGDATSSNYALKVDNISGAPILYARNDVGVSVGSSTISSAFSVYSPYSIVSRLISSSVGTRGSLYVEGLVGSSLVFNDSVSYIAEFGGSSTTGAFIHANSTYIGLSVNNGSGYSLIIKPSGVINTATRPTSNAGLTSGDEYVDTAANILANGDKVVGWKV